jgi:hypothetical protein
LGEQKGEQAILANLRRVANRHSEADRSSAAKAKNNSWQAPADREIEPSQQEIAE